MLRDNYFDPRLMVVLALLIALPVVLPNYFLFLATSIIISSILTSSVGLVTGMAGMVSLCQLSFAGIGGWVVAFLNANDVPVPFVLQILLGGLVAVPIGLLIGLPALRVRGVNLAVVTFGFAAITDLIFTVVNFPGGVIGKPILRPDWLSSDKNYYWFCLIVAVLVIVGLNQVYRGRFGSAWLAVKHSERATAALGLSVPQTKLSAFALSAFVAGISGGLIGGQLGLLSASNFAPVSSLVLFAVGVMVGARYAEGAILAGAMAWLVPEILNRLRLPQDLGNLIFALGTIQALKDGGGVFEVISRKRKPKMTIANQVAPIQESNISKIEQPSSNNIALELQHLTVSYGQVQALTAVSLQLLEGRVLGLIGPNGAGKSSLVDALTGFVAYQGSVKLEGKTLEGLNATERARTGLRRSFQQDRTIPDLSAKAYLELSAGRVLSTSELQEALAFAQLENPNIELHHLDVGTRRLLEVAGVLAAKPKVVLLDEPAAGLSSEESLALGLRIASIPSHYGCAVLLIEHDMDVVRTACSEVAVLDFGALIAQGSTSDVLMRREVIAAYLGEEVHA
jgi:branched-chain amino acid transport system permease protein